MRRWLKPIRAKRWWKWCASRRPRCAAVLEPLERPRSSCRGTARRGSERDHERDHGVRLERALDRDAAEQQPEQVRAAVAHEDRRRMEVVDQEAERRAGVIAASTPARRAPEVERDDREATAMIAQTPAASPSTPSEKLTTFIRATRPITVSGPAADGVELQRADERQRDVLHRARPPRPGSAPPRSGRASFTPGAGSKRSSSAPISVIIAAPSRMPVVCWVDRQPDRGRDEHAGEDRQAAEQRRGSAPRARARAARRPRRRAPRAAPRAASADAATARATRKAQRRVELGSSDAS